MTNVSSTFRCAAVSVAAFCFSTAAAVRAYEPPVAAAGPLAVRIVGPETVAALDAPQTIEVRLENKSDRALAGTLELGVVDHWRVESPAKRPFTLPAKGQAQQTFRVTAGAGTHSAIYPVHAWARFRDEGQELVAHPILLLQTKFESPPRAQPPLPWKSLALPPDGALALWQTPIHRTIVAPNNEKPETQSVGWQGSHPRTHATCSMHAETLAGERRETLNLHPPYANGHVGAILVEYPLALPKTAPVRLDFATGQRADGQSDGVTYRVRVAPGDAPDAALGKIAWEEHRLTHKWQSGQADLTPWAGQTVRLQLEAHPGPKNNTGWDSCCWAEPTVLAGKAAHAAARTPPPQGETLKLGKAGAYDVEVQLGSRGLLDARIAFRMADKTLEFRGFAVRVAGARLDDPRSPQLLHNVKTERTADGWRVRHSFAGPTDAYDLVCGISVARGMFHAAFRLENGPPPQPWRVVRLEDIAAGPWNQTARQVYAGVGNVLREPEAFQLHFDGHRLATSFVGFDFAQGVSMVQAADLAPEMLDVRPAERHYSLHVPHAATLSFAPAPSVWDGAKVWRAGNGWRAGGGVARAAGRFVFDLWGGQYAASARELEKAFQYGLTDALVVWHVWQRWGYDYRLPDICPPDPRLGTTAELKELIDVCRRRDVPIALHDNYIDFYPDADGFSYDRQIAFHSPNQPVKAWLNEGRQAQSYRFRADQIEPFLQANVRWIRENLGPTAYFIDVWSSAGPYDYWTFDGQFFDRTYTRDQWRRHFAWIRDQLGGNAPQISESGHDQLVGWLDGAQTNHLRVGQPGPGKMGWTVWNVRCADAERTPWLDAAHHDRFILHGAGYPGRYEGGLPPRLHGIDSDDYLATEVLTGHPGMVSRPFDRDVVRKFWLLGGLGRALALRTLERVEYVDGDLHRQHVVWSGGAEAWVNRGPADWTVVGQTLPEFGFLARVPGPNGNLQTALVRREGQIVETAERADDLYVNGREVVDSRQPIVLRALGLEQKGPRSFDLRLRWQADAPAPPGYHPFLHLVDEEGEIVAQPGITPAESPLQRPGAFDVCAHFSLSERLPLGKSYELRYGIYHLRQGSRMALVGPDDGTRRIRLGNIRLEGADGQVKSMAWSDHHAEPDPWLLRQNAAGKPVDFGALVTAGACRLTREGQSLLVTPLPQPPGKRFQAQLRWDRLPWKLPAPQSVERLGPNGQAIDRVPLTRAADGTIFLNIPAENFAWRIGTR